MADITDASAAAAASEATAADATMTDATAAIASDAAAPSDASPPARAARGPRRGTAEARALLQSYLRTLSRHGNHDDMVHVMCNEGVNGDFFPQRTWLNVNFGDASRKQVAHVRAFIEIVGRLAHSTDFRWREFYHAFWQRTLMDPLACSACRQTFDRNPDPTEYDDFERLMASSAPRFVLDFSKTGEPDEEEEAEDGHGDDDDDEGNGAANDDGERGANDDAANEDGDGAANEAGERGRRPHACNCGHHHDEDEDDNYFGDLDDEDVDDDDNGEDADDAEDASSEKDKLTMLRDFLFMDPERALSEKHMDALTRLTANRARVRPATAASSSGNSSDDDGDDSDAVTAASDSMQPPRIELGLVLSAHSVSTAEYRALAELLEEFAEREQTKRDDGGVWTRFTITTLWVLPDKPLSPVDFELLTSIVASETAPIRHFMFGYAAVTLAAVDRMRAFQQFLRTTVCVSGDAEAETEPTLETLRLHDAPLEHEHVASVCAALRYPSSLKELTIEWEDELSAPGEFSPELMWAWLAFGVFHPDSAARLDHVDISGLPLNRDDMVAFDAVLRSPHPARQLWLAEHGELPRGSGLDEIALPAGQRVLVQLRAGAKVRASPKVRADVLVTVAPDAQELEVAIALRKWVCVVVPGSGLGWVAITSIVAKREVASKVRALPDVTPDEADVSAWAVAGPNVKTFARHMLDEDVPEEELGEDEEPPGVVDEIEDVKLLLRMIGPSLEGLDYPLHDIDISEDDLREMLASCPNLKHLNLKGNALVSIAPVVERYREQQCRIRSLNIDSVTEQNVIMEQLTELLASPCSKPLRYVEANGLVETTERLNALADALRSNASLELLSLYLEYPENGDVLSEIQADVEGFVLDSQLSARTKVAFLSVVHHYTNVVSSSTGDVSSLGQLDASVVSEIFAFAAIPIPRSMIW